MSCNSHKKNLLIAAASKLLQIRNYMTNINKSFVFYSFSHKGQEFLERVNDATVHRNSQHDDSKQNRHKKLKGLCKTR